MPFVALHFKNENSDRIYRIFQDSIQFKNPVKIS
jgi:hypothetical protein